MAHSSSGIALRKLFGPDAVESKVQGAAAFTIFETPLSNASTQDLEEGTNGPDNTDINIPRADGGRDAWFFLAACFVFEALVWGKWSFLCKSTLLWYCSGRH